MEGMAICAIRFLVADQSSPQRDRDVDPHRRRRPASPDLVEGLGSIPPAVAARSTSFTVASRAWPTALTSSRLLRMRARSRFGPTIRSKAGTRRRLFGDEPANAGHVSRTWLRVIRGCVSAVGFRQRPKVRRNAVGQQLSGRGQGSGIPGWCRHNRRVGSCVEERRNADHRRHAIGDGVVDPTNMPTRWSGSPVRNAMSHSGRDMSSGCRRRCSTTSRSSASPPGGGTGNSWRCWTISKL